MKDNGNTLIKGSNLTSDQLSLLKFNGASNPEWVKNHSFWFKNGKPSQEDGFYYPVCNSLSQFAIHCPTYPHNL